MKFILGWLVLSIAVGLTVLIVPGIDVDYTLGIYWAISAVFGLVNVVLGTILRVLGWPLLVVTWGLFGLVINALLFLVTDALMDSLTIDGFLPALVGAVIMAFALMVVEGVTSSIERGLQRPVA